MSPVENNTTAVYGCDIASRLTGVVHGNGGGELYAVTCALNAVSARASRGEAVVGGAVQADSGFPQAATHGTVPKRCAAVVVAWVAAGAGLMAAATVEPAPEVIRHTNPVWDGEMADPAVLRAGAAWYAYGTGSTPQGDRIPILRSADFLHWEHVGYAFPKGAGAPPMKTYWAPEVVEHGGRYFLYWTGNGRVRVAVAESPAGPFQDTGTVLLPDEWNIDGHPFRDPDSGEWFFFFARNYPENDRPGTGLAVVRLGGDMRSVTGPVVTVSTPHAAWQVFTKGKFPDRKGTRADWHCVEGPWVVKRSGRYYCFYSGANWKTPDYGVGYLVAEHPLGPWSDPENSDGPRVLRGGGELIGPGHNSIALSAVRGMDFIVFHAWDPGHTRRQMCLAPLQWTPQGPRAEEAGWGECAFHLPGPAGPAAGKP